MASQADHIRNYVIKNVIQPVRIQGQSSLWITSGDVHRAIGLKNRMPAVCSALDGGKFQEEAGVTLITREGPLQGATVKWHFSLK